MWLTIVSMTTVGYGDVYPQTYPGRAFAVFSFVFGNFLTSYITTILANKLDFNEQELRTFILI